MWIPGIYPSAGPLCYIKPTETMLLKEGHMHIDHEGRIYHPYLSDWNLRSSLVDLQAQLSVTFSHDPPLYAKPPGYREPVAKVRAHILPLCRTPDGSRAPPGDGMLPPASPSSAPPHRRVDLRRLRTRTLSAPLPRAPPPLPARAPRCPPSKARGARCSPRAAPPPLPSLRPLQVGGCG